MKFVYDTYALIEIFKGNSNYAPYANLQDAVLTEFVLTELYYNILRDHGPKVAGEYCLPLVNNCLHIPFEVIKSAMSFRLNYPKNKTDRTPSYVDALGYAFSKELKIKFLTGDNAFKELENVEFIK